MNEDYDSQRPEEAGSEYGDFTKAEPYVNLNGVVYMRTDIVIKTLERIRGTLDHKND